MSAPPRTLCFDCGGGGIKAALLGGDGGIVEGPVRVPTPYPLRPELLVETFVGLASTLPPAGRITVGMPGMIRRGVVIETPHYVTKQGPRSKVVPSLLDAWQSFDMRAAVEVALGLPTLVLNDAEVAGAAVVEGVGLEMILTLGTGLGNAMFLDGRLAPHAELSQGLVRWGLTYDDYLGEHERLRLGDAHWSGRVRRVIEGFVPVYRWDRLYLGGGNARRVTDHHRAKLPAAVTFVPNEAGMTGGVRAWELPGAQDD